MSILEVTISITVMGMIGIVIGSSFSGISATHQAADDMVDARRLVQRQLAIFDEAFAPFRVYPPPVPNMVDTSTNPADAFNWGLRPPVTPASVRYLPTEIQKGATNFPDLWNPALTPYVISITANPASPADVNQAYVADPNRATVSDIPGVTTFQSVAPYNAWHVWSELQADERNRLDAREIALDLYLARLDILDTQPAAAGYTVNPYRYREGNSHLWWIAQIDVRRGATILQTVYRIGP